MIAIHIDTIDDYAQTPGRLDECDPDAPSHQQVASTEPDPPDQIAGAASHARTTRNISKL